MISVDNVPLNSRSNDSDFTVESYRRLLVLAKRSYAFASYSEIPWGQRFVLWRHDCDYSLNRAHALARVEVEEGIRATYFLNPHCEFYSLLEKSQHRLVREIVGMGHDIGLHFDAAFHDISDEEMLGQQVRAEAALLEELYDVKVSVFSFHNPVASHMNCEAETYGGLVNCYSRRFKTEVPYCSDSNGYWRFRRLQDVLLEAADPCLQVLTHPDWWQESEMPPRQRIFRSVYGRAKATMRLYDAGLSAHGRQNIAGAMDALDPLKTIDPSAWDVCDLLWNRGDFPALFCELWRIHERDIRHVLAGYLRNCLHVPPDVVDSFLQEAASLVDGMALAELVLGANRKDIGGDPAAMHDTWLAHRRDLMRGRELADGLLEQGCVYLCGMIRSLASWGDARLGSFGNLSDQAMAECNSPSGGGLQPADVSAEWERIVQEVKDWRLANSPRRGDETCD